jgi:phage gp46-like protein
MRGSMAHNNTCVMSVCGCTGPGMLTSGGRIMTQDKLQTFNHISLCTDRSAPGAPGVRVAWGDEPSRRGVSRQAFQGWPAGRTEV